MPELNKNKIKFPELFKIKWVYILSVLFILINAALIVKDYYWGILIPFAILAALLFIFSLDKMLLIITFLTPLAINVNVLEGGMGVSIPTEPLMFVAMLVFFLKLLFEGHFDRKITRHIVTIFIIINLSWITVTTCTSELLVVSLKFLMARLWFVIPFYFMATQLFRDKKNIGRFLWAYTISLIIVVIYTTIHHSMWGFAEKPGNWVMQPFYNDHTAYGAIIAFFVPIAALFAFGKAYSKTARLVGLVALFILIIALFISYSRAAWLSVVAVFGIYMLIRLKIKFRWILIPTLVLFGLFFAFQDQIMYKLEKNNQDSSSNFVEHIQSISNISTDASNLERINRWACALRMFEARPVFGWGPGTYQFEYAPFQRYRERTIISTNAGDGGNAHSEYIGPLAEEGVLGLLSFLAIAIAALFYGFKVYSRLEDKELKGLCLAVTLSLTTYFVHGFLNNFLDTDKLAVPFWGSIAIIVAIDVYHSGRKSLTDETQNEEIEE